MVHLHNFPRESRSLGLLEKLGLYFTIPEDSFLRYPRRNLFTTLQKIPYSLPHKILLPQKNLLRCPRRIYFIVPKEFASIFLEDSSFDTLEECPFYPKENPFLLPPFHTSFCASLLELSSNLMLRMEVEFPYLYPSSLGL